jgi:hypothetical protein
MSLVSDNNIPFYKIDYNLYVLNIVAMAAGQEPLLVSLLSFSGNFCFLDSFESVAVVVEVLEKFVQ